jgi:nucleoside-diphosphate-sugar epimerase
LGGTGFLGKNLAERLKSKGYRRVIDWIGSKHYDLTYTNDVSRFFKEQNPDIVINCAGHVGGIQANMAAPGDFFWKNMLICGNVINESYKYGHLSKLIQVGTTCSYAGDVKVPTREDYLGAGLPEASNRPYGISKLAIYYMLQGYREQYGLNGIYIIPTNMIGKYDTMDESRSHVAAALIKRMYRAKRNIYPSVTIWSDGTPTRDFVDAGDVADGIITAMETYDGADAINLGSGKEVSIRELAYYIKEVVGYEGELEFDASKPGGQRRRCLDISRAKSILGWEPKTNIIESLTNCYNYYRENNVNT